MRVLILTQHYSPEPFPRPSDLATWLTQRGHDVLVLTGFPYYPTSGFYPGARLGAWSREVVGGIKVLRLPLYPYHGRSAIRRAMNYGSFSLSIALLGTVLCGHADVAYVEHPSTLFGLGAWVLSRFRGIPFLYLVDDVWPDSVEASGMLRGHHRLLGGIDRTEKFLYRRARAIAVISEENRALLREKGVPSEKLHFIPHYANEHLYRPVEPDPELAARLGTAGRFTVVFGGSIGMAQALDVVLSAAEDLEDTPEIVFLLVGDGPDFSRLQQATRTRRLRNVRFVGRRPAEEMPHVYALADALLVHLRDSPVFRRTIPSKTMAYLACARPIIMAMEGEAARLIRSAGAGLTCPADDPRALAKTVRELRGLTPETRRAMAEAGRDLFLTSHTRDVVMRRYEGLLSQISRRQKTRT
jgi:colanic acid biosynthesis glycosyl transferase WcaI